MKMLHEFSLVIWLFARPPPPPSLFPGIEDDSLLRAL